MPKRAVIVIIKKDEYPLPPINKENQLEEFVQEIVGNDCKVSVFEVSKCKCFVCSKIFD